MKLSDAVQPLIAPLLAREEYASLISGIAASSPDSLQIEGLSGSAQSVLMAAVAAGTQRTQIVVAAGRDEAMSLYDDLENLLGEKGLPPVNKKVLFFPTLYRREHAPAESDSRHLLLRAETMRALARWAPG